LINGSLPVIADEEAFSFLKWAAPASDLRRPQNLGWGIGIALALFILPKQSYADHIASAEWYLCLDCLL
jgi:hypothetical protein